MRRLFPSCLVVFSLAAVSPVLAGSAADAVRFFYDHAGTEMEEANRDRFTGPARELLDANDRSWEENGEVCLDFSFTVDGQDFDEDEIARTLALDEAVSGASAVVNARFSLFGEPRHVEWSLAREGNAWKVADIASPETGWRLSEFTCE